MSERLLENLNRALRESMASDERVVLIGEDIADPYGGAFKVTRGLQNDFPDRVLTTPISELGFSGFANGLALAGQRPIVEFMFGDFIFLAADQIINFAAKSVDMYGDSHPHSIIFRCPVGGHRGYGATHSQSVQKHFLGVPGLDLFEASTLHDACLRLPELLDAERPAILFEQKTSYARPMLQPGNIDDFFVFDHIDEQQRVARVRVDEGAEVLLLCPGGQFEICHEAARNLLLNHGIECEIRVPFAIHPCPQELFAGIDERCHLIVTVEESAPGGTWGSEVNTCLAGAGSAAVSAKFLSVTAANSPVPSARHLEQQVLPDASKVESLIAAACQ